MPFKSNVHQLYEFAHPIFEMFMGYKNVHTIIFFDTLTNGNENTDLCFHNLIQCS